MSVGDGVDRVVGQRPQLVVGAVLDRMRHEDRAGSAPSARDWASAASTNSVDATNTIGMPAASMFTVSCTLHDVHEPQSASASITTSHFVVISWRRSTGAGLVNVGLAKRVDLDARARAAAPRCGRGTRCRGAC